MVKGGKEVVTIMFHIDCIVTETRHSDDMEAWMFSGPTGLYENIF